MLTATCYPQEFCTQRNRYVFSCQPATSRPTPACMTPCSERQAARQIVLGGDSAGGAVDVEPDMHAQIYIHIQNSALSLLCGHACVFWHLRRGLEPGIYLTIPFPPLANAMDFSLMTVGRAKQGPKGGCVTVGLMMIAHGAAADVYR